MDLFIPTLETARLRLREHGPSDLADCVAMWADPAVASPTIGTPSTLQQTWMRILAYRGHWAFKGYGYWAIEERVTGRYIGELGFADFKRAPIPDLVDVPEMGWVLSPAVHGRGFATEAVRAAITWADANFPATFCNVRASNAPSVRVAERAGFHEVLRGEWNGEPLITYRRDRSASESISAPEASAP